VEADHDSDRTAGLVSRVSRLRLDAAAAEALQCFGRAGVRALLLKGAATTSWLYLGRESRPYVDCDLLVCPDDVEAAARALRSLHYSQTFDERAMPSWWREHAGTWVRHGDQLTIDLHHTLPGVGVDAWAAWRTLSRDADTVPVAGWRAPTLCLAGRALHVALHAAQHGVGVNHPLADLERALTFAEPELWIEAAGLATELDATDSFAAGLRLMPAGAMLAERLGLPPPRSVDAQLRAASPPPVALGFEQLARARGLRARAEIVVRKLVPPPEFIRHWDPRAGKGRAALLRAYLRRPFWILRRAPCGLRVWRRARREVR